MHLGEATYAVTRKRPQTPADLVALRHGGQGARQGLAESKVRAAAADSGPTGCWGQMGGSRQTSRRASPTVPGVSPASMGRPPILMSDAGQVVAALRSSVAANITQPGPCPLQTLSQVSRGPPVNLRNPSSSGVKTPHRSPSSLPTIWLYLAVTARGPRLIVSSARCQRSSLNPTCQSQGRPR